MSVSVQRNIGAYLEEGRALASVAIASCSTDENDPKSGLTIDRFAYSRKYESAKAVLAADYGQASAGTGKVVTVGLRFQHSSDASSWDYLTTETTLVVGATTTSTAALSAKATVHSQSATLTGARRYLRIEARADHSATSSETTTLTGLVVLGGADELPAA